MKTSKFTVFPVFIAALAAYGAAACGSGEDGSGVEGTPGGSNTPDQPNLGNPNAPDSGLTRPHDGGTEELTPEEVENIMNLACAGWAGEGENLPAVLQLVVDVSGSMEDDAPGGRGRSKWEVTREALRDALETLPASAAVGVLYYPNRDNELDTRPRPVDECVNVDAMTPIEMLGGQGSPHRDDLDQSLDDANTGSYTPTHDAYKYALENGLQPYQSQANKFMLLITDGAPTMALQCIGEEGPDGMGGTNVLDSPTEPIVDDIAAAAATGIRTFIIGSPGSEESSNGDDKRPWLSEAAQVGGTAAAGCAVAGPAFCHMDMTQEADFAQALVDGLGAVVGQIVDQCTFTFPEPPMGETIDAEKTTLIVTTSSGSKVVKPDNTGACTEGWQLTSDGQIQLCPASCDQVKTDPTARVQLLFGCTTDQVVPVE